MIDSSAGGDEPAFLGMRAEQSEPTAGLDPSGIRWVYRPIAAYLDRFPGTGQFAWSGG
jgi:hypothetical protein